MKITKNGKIVAYTPGSTFNQGELNNLPDLKSFVFQSIADVDSEPVNVKVVDINLAKEALGVGSSYEAEWGDFRHIIAGIKNKEVVCMLKTTTYEQVEI